MLIECVFGASSLKILPLLLAIYYLLRLEDYVRTV